MKSNISKHPCANKCADYKDEQCKTCLVPELPSHKSCDADYLAGDTVVLDNELFPELNRTYVVKEHLSNLGGVIIFLHRNETRCLHDRDIRPATVAEIQANRRLTNAELSQAEVS